MMDSVAGTYILSNGEEIILLFFIVADVALFFGNLIMVIHERRPEDAK